MTKKASRKKASKKQASKKAASKKATRKPRTKTNKKTNGTQPKQPAKQQEAEPLLQMPGGSQATLGGAWDVPRTQSLVEQIGSTALSASQLAGLLGVVPSTVTTMSNEGMPSRGGGAQGRRAEYHLNEVLPWLVKRGGKRASIDARDMVQRETAIKLARANAVDELSLIYTDDIGPEMKAMVTHLATAHESLPGRLCNELAAESPAVIEDILRRELRKILSGFAAALAKQAESIGIMADDLRHSATAAGPDA